ncbi:hypothetical protein D3C84_786230 [compost metagenome]
MYLITPYLIEYVFGNKYKESIKIINYLIWVIPIFYIASSAGSTLITGTYMLKKIKYMGLTAAISVIATTSLIPILGVHAGAASLVISFSVLANRNYVFADLSPQKNTPH